jgi:iron-sulfur cluster repair protein YtfE (RIC family)
MNSSRRHDSLIPLSHDHHHALVLCLRIHRGLEKQGGDEAWLRSMTEDTLRFFASDLTPHFKIEEEVLFPAMQRLAEAAELIGALLSEHRALEGCIELLRQTQVAGLEDRLRQFADLLKLHIRKEENQLFPLYEKATSQKLADTIGQEIRARRR